MFWVYKVFVTFLSWYLTSSLLSLRKIKRKENKQSLIFVNGYMLNWFQRAIRDMVSTILSQMFPIVTNKIWPFFQSNFERLILKVFKISCVWILNWWNHVMNICMSIEHTQPYSSNFWGAVCTITELAKRGFHTHHFPSSHGRCLLLEKIANTPATGKLKNTEPWVQRGNPLSKILAGIEMKKLLLQKVLNF